MTAPDRYGNDSATPAALFPGASWWICAVILTMPVREIALAQAGRAHLRIGDVVLAVAVAWWFASTGGRIRLQRNPLDCAVLGLVLVHVISILWSTNYEYALVRSMKLTRNGLLYVLLVSYLRTDFRGGFRTIALSLVTTGLMQSVAFLYGVAQNGGTEALRSLFDASLLMSNDPRLLVVKGNASAGLFLKGAAIWLSLCIFFGIGLTAFVRTTRSRRLVWMTVVLMGAVTLLTMTRTAWLGLAVGGGVVSLSERARKRVNQIALAAVACVAVVAVGWYEPLTNVLTARFGNVTNAFNDPSLEARLEFFWLAFEQFQRSPLVGTGVGNIDPSVYTPVHNVYLQVLGELGTLGTLILAIVLWQWVWSLVRARRYSGIAGTEDNRLVTGAMLGATAFFLTFFLAGHELEGSEPWLVLATSSAVYAASKAAVRLRRTASPPQFSVPTPVLRLT